MMKIKNDFPLIIDNYFNKHLSLERKFSENTYSSYLIVIKQYVNFLELEGRKRKDIGIKDFDKETIIKFLNYVENDLSCSSKTRNQKLTIINSFLEYAQSCNPIYLKTYLDSKSIKSKRIIDKKMDYLSIDELKIFMNSIDLKHKSGYKHYVIISFLYETALRVSELINIKIENLFLNGKNPYIKVLGKGNKERLVYINDEVVTMIEEYINKFKIKEGYLFLNHSQNKYTRYGINKIIDKYKNIAEKECPLLMRKTISPHTFRHSKAVHFLENGTALPIIQRFLGHSSIKTTELYLDISNEAVTKAIETAACLIENGKEKACWKNDNKLLDLLESIKN